MANRKLTDPSITELTAISDNDISYVVDVSDTTESPDGTSKRFTFLSLKTYLKSYIDTQLYATISANTTLDNSFHAKTIWVNATCNITIPSGLRNDFYCNVRTLTGATATYLISGTVINAESDGDVQSPKTMVHLAVYTTNNYILSGGGLR